MNVGSSSQKGGRRGGPGHRGGSYRQILDWVEGGRQLPRRRRTGLKVKEPLFTWGMCDYWYVFNRLRHRRLLSTSISLIPWSSSSWLGSRDGKGHWSVPGSRDCLEHSTQPIEEKRGIQLAGEQTDNEHLPHERCLESSPMCVLREVWFKYYVC